MDEYINKNLALSELNKVPAYFENGDIHYGIALAINIVKKLPVVTTSEVKLGTWLKADCSEKDGDSNCSECGHWHWSDCLYCSNCGTKMIKE